MKKLNPQCAKCPYSVRNRLCRTKDGKSPPFCPTENKTGLIEECLEEYKKPDVFEFAKQASVQEGAGYGNKESGYDRVKPVVPRILEIIQFALRMKYTRLGLAFCVALRKEAKIVEKLFSSKGFDMVSVICKVGQAPKEIIGIREEEKVAPETFETMCNPVLQALILNNEKTEFNVLLGLCVGHDSLFFKYAEAPCTVLAVKDRVLCHNPLGAIYNIDSYYRYLKASD